MGRQTKRGSRTRHLLGLTAAFVISTHPAAVSAQAPTPTPTQGMCPQATPELLSVDSVISPTDELAQEITVYIGNGERVDVVSEAGTFTAEGSFSRENPACVTVTLLPQVANHLEVIAYVRTISQGECTYGGYSLRTTVDLHGAPLTIIQGSDHGPTIRVEPETLTLSCSGSFDIEVSNASPGDDTLEISFLAFHHGYSQGEYGTGFTWDTNQLTLPVSLARGESIALPVSYSGADQGFDSRLVLQIVSNARNNDETQFVTYHGRLCSTPTPTRTPTIDCICPDGSPCDANGLCVIAHPTATVPSHAGNDGCSIEATPRETGSAWMLLAAIFPGWLRRFTLGQRRS